MSEVYRDTKPEKADLKPTLSVEKPKETNDSEKEKAKKIMGLAKSFLEKRKDLEDSSKIFLDAGTREALLVDKESEVQATWQEISSLLKSSGQAYETDVSYGDREVHRVYDDLPTSPQDVSITLNTNGFTINWRSPSFPNNDGYTEVRIDPKTHRITYTSTEITID